MSVAFPHPAYQAMLPLWEDLRNAYIGQEAVKGAQARTRSGRGSRLPGTRYLARPSGMKNEEQYAAYVERPTWVGWTERTVGGLTGAVFRREPQIALPKALEPQVADVTQTGISLRMFSERTVRETLLMGRFGIFVDFPTGLFDTDGRLLAPAKDARPYWVGYPAETILNWRTMQRDGDTILSLVVLEEVLEVPKGSWGTEEYFKIVYQTQYRVLRLNEAGVYEESLWKTIPGPAARGRPTLILDKVWIPLREQQPLTFIPFTFLAPFSLEPTIEKSLLEALVQINFRHYRHSACYEHALWMNGLPTPWIASSLAPQTEFPIGGSVAWLLPPDAKVGMLQTDPAGLPAFQIALENDKHDAAIVGARLLEERPDVQETLGAVVMRHQSGDSPMQSLVSSVSQALTWCLQVHGWWAGLTENVDDPTIGVSLNKDLVSSSMSPQMLTALQAALIQNTISYETYYYNLQQGEIARPFIEVDEEQELITIAKENTPLAPAPAGPQPPGRTGQRRVAA